MQTSQQRRRQQPQQQRGTNDNFNRRRKRKRTEPLDPDVVALLNKRIAESGEDERSAVEGGVQDIDEQMMAKLRGEKRAEQQLEDDDDEEEEEREEEHRRDAKRRRVSSHERQYFARVHLPVDKDPRLVALIIGKGGSTIKHIQIESGGASLKIVDTDPSRVHVAIRANSKESLEKARNMVETYLPRDEPKSQEAVEQAKSGFAKDGNHTGPTPDAVSTKREFSDKIPLPVAQYPRIASAVVGRGGEVIKRIRTESGAYLRVTGQGAEDAHVFISARTHDSLKLAKEMVMDVLKDAEKRYQTSEERWQSNQQRTGFENRENLVRSVVYLPLDEHPHIASLIVGRGGQMIKHIESESGASVRIRTKGDEKPRVLITSKSKESVDKGKEMVEKLIANEQEVQRQLLAGDNDLVSEQTEQRKFYVPTFAEREQEFSRVSGDTEVEQIVVRPVVAAEADLWDLENGKLSDDVFITMGFQRDETSDHIDLFNQLILSTLPLYQRYRLQKMHMQQLAKNSSAFVDIVTEKVTDLREVFENQFLDTESSSEKSRRSDNNGINAYLNNNTPRIRDMLAKLSLFWGGESLRQLSESYYHDLQRNDFQSLTTAHLWTIVGELSTSVSNDEIIQGSTDTEQIARESHNHQNQYTAAPQFTQLQKLSIMESAMAPILNSTFEEMISPEKDTRVPVDPATVQRALDRIVERSYLGLDKETEVLMFTK